MDWKVIGAVLMLGVLAGCKGGSGPGSSGNNSQFTAFVTRQAGQTIDNEDAADVESVAVDASETAEPVNG